MLILSLTGTQSAGDYAFAVALQWVCLVACVDDDAMRCWELQLPLW